MLYSRESLGLGIDEGFSPEVPDEVTPGEPAGVLRERVVLPLPVPQPSITVEASYVVSLSWKSESNTCLLNVFSLHVSRTDLESRPPTGGRLSKSVVSRQKYFPNLGLKYTYVIFCLI